MSVIPTVLLPLGGLEGRLGVRLLYDLDAWILTSKMTASQTLAETCSILWERIKADNPSGTAESPGGGGGLVDFPISFRNPRKVRFELCAPVGPLPSAIIPMSQDSEQLIVHKLLSELNTLHCMKLNEKPELKRGVCLQRARMG